MSAPTRHRRSTAARCDEGGDAHTWEARGLDINDEGVLVNVRECVRCDAAQEKPYGAGSRRSWTDVARRTRDESEDR